MYNSATFRTEGSQIKVACRGRGRKKRRRLGKPARFVGKIKKGEEEIRRQAALTFSGGWVNNAHGTQATGSGEVVGSAKWRHKEARMCLFGNLPFLFSFFPLLHHWNRATARFLSLFPATIPKDLCPLGRGATEERGRGRGSRQSRNSGEREGWVEGGLKGKRRKNHDAIIFVPARERILSSSSSRAG